MNLAESIDHRLADIPAGAKLVSVDAHEDPDYAPGTVGALCEFDSGDMFLLSVPLEGKPFDSAKRAEVEIVVSLAVALTHGLRVPEASHV